MRVDKEVVDYGRGMKSAHCAICTHFRPPQSCEKVVGKISPQGWCKLFRKKETK